MAATDFILWLNRNAFWFIILIVIGFIVYSLWPKKKTEPGKESVAQQTIKGFGIMKDKIADSDLVQGIVKANDDQDAFGLNNDLGNYGIESDDNYQWGLEPPKK